jgi:hypothetical protein
VNEASDGLQIAANRGHVGVAQMMLDAGANVNQVGGEWGSTLQVATHGAHVRLVCQLLVQCRCL